MKYIKYLMLIGLMFVFSGCVNRTNVIYNEDYLKTELNKEIKQVSSQKVDLKKKEAVYLTKFPTSVNGALVELNVNLTAINEDIQREFFNQYFKEVNYVKETTENLFIDSTLYNYEHSYPLNNGTQIELFMKMKVYYKNKLILNKEYYIKDNVIMLFTMRFSLKEIKNEAFQKTLFKLYETQFKPDLLKALEENK